MIEDCTAIILAGGESKRMGQDKASMLLNGETLLQRTLDQVSPLFSKTYLSVRDTRNQCEYPQVQDTRTERSPIIGIATALSQCATPWVFVVACDMPFIVPALIVQMAKQRKAYQVVVPRCQGFYQPLLAFYHQSCLQPMQTQIANGQRSLQRLIQTLDSNTLAENWLKKYDADLESFFDLDTPNDFKKAKPLSMKKD